MVRFLTMFLAAAMIIPTFANAQDEGLYDPVAPDGSAFFRFINADSNKGDNETKAGKKSYGNVKFQKISSYYVIPEGDVTFAFGDKEEEAKLEENKYYSVIRTKDEVLVKEDTPLTNMSKSLITFYNFTSEDNLSLKTAGKDIAVVDKIAANGNGSREINAVKINLAIANEEEEIGVLEPILLERKNAYTVAAFTDENEKVLPIMVKAKTDTTK